MNTSTRFWKRMFFGVLIVIAVGWVQYVEPLRDRILFLEQSQKTELVHARNVAFGIALVHEAMQERLLVSVSGILAPDEYDVRMPDGRHIPITELFREAAMPFSSTLHDSSRAIPTIVDHNGVELLLVHPRDGKKDFSSAKFREMLRKHAFTSFQF